MCHYSTICLGATGLTRTTRRYGANWLNPSRMAWTARQLTHRRCSSRWHRPKTRFRLMWTLRHRLSRTPCSCTTLLTRRAARAHLTRSRHLAIYYCAWTYGSSSYARSAFGRNAFRTTRRFYGGGRGSYSAAGSDSAYKTVYRMSRSKCRRPATCSGWTDPFYGVFGGPDY